MDVFDVKIETNKKFIHEKFIMKLKNIVLSILLSSSVTISSTVYAEDVPFSQELVEQAKSGNAEAQNNLGDAYYYGNDVDQDFGKALEWFKKSAAKGNADALFSVGYMYDYGEGTEEDNPTALKWYTQAAQKGQLYAQYYLGFLYLYGDEGVGVNSKKGLEWMTKSADGGLDLAQAELGHLYNDGRANSNMRCDSLKSLMIINKLSKFL